MTRHISKGHEANILTVLEWFPTLAPMLTSTAMAVSAEVTS